MTNTPEVPAHRTLRQPARPPESAAPTAFELAVGDWATLGEGARVVREAVFVQEQGIAREDEWDEADATAVHAVVTTAQGEPVATGRLLNAHDQGAGSARIGRMAVLGAWRGAGLGQWVVQALEQAARARGDQRVVLSAQRSAEGFYQRLGYTPYGEPFDEVGIPHLHMQRVLAAAPTEPAP
jgi:predicted GNAT family N-acyltransferase